MQVYHTLNPQTDVKMPPFRYLPNEKKSIDHIVKRYKIGKKNSSVFNKFSNRNKKGANAKIHS